MIALTGAVVCLAIGCLLIWYVQRQMDKDPIASRNELDKLVTKLYETADGWTGSGPGLASAIKKEVERHRKA